MKRFALLGAAGYIAERHIRAIKVMSEMPVRWG